jgi:Antitoxin of toxin-antitoxin stability system
MLQINITDFRKNIPAILKQTIKLNEPVNIRTKNGNVVIISEEDYNRLMGTLYLIEGMKTPVSECIPEDKVDW